MADTPTIDLGGADAGDLRIAHEVGVDPLTGQTGCPFPRRISAVGR